MFKEKLKALIFMKEYSERLHGKNMKKLCGKPLFHWILKALQDSNVINEIIINTDSEKIAKNAKENFNVTIHMRPDYLLDIDHDEANKIMAYDIDKIAGEHFIQSHSTNPLVNPKSIRKACKLYFKNLKMNDSLFSVTKTTKRFFLKNGQPINHDPKKLIKTQELEPLLEENSCFYIFSRKSFFLNKNRIGSKPILFPIDPLTAIDIDEAHDFKFAEYLMNYRIKNGINFS